MLRAARTARHLPASQTLAWLRRRLFAEPPCRPLATDEVMRSPQWRELVAAALELEGRRDRRPEVAEAAVDHTYRFVGTERRLPRIDWSAEIVSPLWTFQLHYLDVAVDLARAWRATADRRFLAACDALWTSWIDAAEEGRARIAAYPTSVRCMNALRTLWLLEDALPGPSAERLLGSTHAQLRWLERRLERHLGANHLQKNLTALAWGHLAFDGPTAAAWDAHRDELWTLLFDQVLEDGVHYERSPMYHVAALDDFARTTALSRAVDEPVPAGVDERLYAMAGALRALSRTDGTLHLFNDAANGELPSRREALDVAGRALGRSGDEPVGAFCLDVGGYYGCVWPGAGRRLVIDAGPPGPARQPGHAHCDMLSFELDLRGRPIVVDAGVHGYDGDRFREYARSTRAHNTVGVDGREQHEMWATFRVARRGEIIEARAAEAGGGVADGTDFVFHGACRPYHDRQVVHRRRIELRDTGLHVTDRVDGATGRVVTAWLHLAPDYRLRRRGDVFVARPEATDGPRVAVRARGGEPVLRRGESDPRQGWHFPAFGEACAAAVLELRMEDYDGREFGWEILEIEPED